MLVVFVGFVARAPGVRGTVLAAFDDHGELGPRVALFQGHGVSGMR